MPNGESKNWIRFCASIDGYRARFGIWPEIVLVPEFFAEELSEVLSNWHSYREKSSHNDAGTSAMTVKRIDWHLPAHLKRTLTGSRPPYYLHRLSAWMWRSLMALALLLSLTALGFVFTQAFQGKMGVAEWILGLFVLPFLVLLTRPTTWRSPVAIVADFQGLYFIGGSGEQEHTFVPWQDIGALSIERHASGNGMIKTVVIGIKGQSSFWDPAVESRFMRRLLQPVQSDGFRRLPLGNMGVSTKRTMAALSYLRQYSASTGAQVSLAKR